MNLFRRTAPTLALLSAVLVVGASGGAVAGAMITGAQIKNGTVTTLDVKDGNLKAKDLSAAARSSLKGLQGDPGADGVQGPQGVPGPQGDPGPSTIPGYELLFQDEAVTANNAASLEVSCPAGKKVLGTSAFWVTSSIAVQAVTSFDGAKGTGFTPGIGTNDTLRVRIVCATVS